MTIFIFAGPSLSAAEASQLLTANYLPPVAQGDIIGLLRFKPTAIGIIDGYFDSVPAVWHKEILYALSQGIHVAGAASMGALRASELHTFGMVGIGEIFRWYRDGLIDADDEVALHHASAEYGYRPFSEPLVNIRKTLMLAQSAGAIDQALHDRLIAIARRTAYWERSYPRLLADAAADGAPAAALDAIERFLGESAVDLKRQDAIALVQYLAGWAHQPRQVEPAFQLQRTTLLEVLLDRDQTVPHQDGVRLTIEELVDNVRLLPDFVDIKMRAVLDTIMLDLARRLDLKPDEEDRKRAQEKLLSGDSPAGWQQRNGVGQADFEHLLDERATIDKLRKIYEYRLSRRRLLARLRMEGRYETALAAALALHTAPYSSPTDAARQEQLLQAYFDDVGQDAPDDLHQLAATLGFDSFGHFLLALENRYGKQ